MSVDAKLPFPAGCLERFVDWEITRWRRQRDSFPSDDSRVELAKYHIDVYQSIRVNLIGQFLE